MSNMSYCRFENTYKDLQDCKDRLDDEDVSELSKLEFKYAKMLVDLCREISNTEFIEFGDVDDDEEEN